MVDFEVAFLHLTGNQPFPWQKNLYEAWFSKGKFPDACILPTGLGKTSVLAVWLIAFTNAPHQVPRRLVYVVNRRTVVDQTTAEAEKLRRTAADAGVVVPEISTLRGQFADNRKWSADPSKPAIICGTVDMIGSRLLFSGYGIGFKSRPLHAGFLGQDALLVHDEAHLEPAFQDLVVAIKKEQEDGERTGSLPWPKLKVMELTATSRGGKVEFRLSDEDRQNLEIQKRIGATKSLRLHKAADDKKLAEEITALALQHSESGAAVLVFVRRVDDVEKILKKLPKGSAEQLTGTLRGRERDGLVKKAVFQRFLPESNRDKDVAIANGTVYLVCTSAGEVGVNISADHMVCDLSTFDSMAQRFGRVNRFGDRTNTRIDVVYPMAFDEKDPNSQPLKKTLQLLQLANGIANPATLGELHQKAMKEGSGGEPASTDRTAALRNYILETYAPQPEILPTSGILFDSWALTTIRDHLPGRPPVAPYLHGISESEPPQTQVAWRKEVFELRRSFVDNRERKQFEKFASDLLEDYPLKALELLRDRSDRVFNTLKKLSADPETPVWIVDEDDTVMVRTLDEIVNGDKELILQR